MGLLKIQTKIRKMTVHLLGSPKKTMVKINQYGLWWTVSGEQTNANQLTTFCLTSK
jgi:hypothetical protein